MKEILVEMSARHIHVSEEALEALFGAGYQVEVVGPKGSLMASILGPTRPATQVELSLTDARTIGVNAPIRESGDIAGTSGCKLVNPENGNEYVISEGVIAAKRHIHLTPEVAKEYGVADKQIVSVEIKSERSAILGDVVVRVSEKFAPAMHIDTDEANATCAFGNVTGIIVG